ncbi:MAG: acetyltransferase [Pseudomonadales bacterium]
MTELGAPENYILLGAGGHAKVVLDLVRLASITLGGVSDPKIAVGALWNNSVPGLSDDDIAQRFPPNSTRLLNGIGSVPGDTLRAQLFERFRAEGYRFETLVHPSAIVAEDISIGEGTQIMAGAILQPGCRIGANSIINTGAIIDHDCEIGANCHIAPGAVLSGAVTLGESVHIGTGAAVIQGIDLGDRCVVGAGATAKRNLVADRWLLPAQPFEKPAD